MFELFDRDHWHEIWVSLSRNRVRTLLTAFGVFWGIFMLVVMLGSGSGLQNGAQQGFSEGATNAFFVWTQRTSKPYKGLPPGRTFEMNNGDIEALRRRVTEADVIAPRVQLGGFRGANNVSRGVRAGAFDVTGDVPGIRSMENIEVIKGRFLNQLDVDERRKVAVVGTRVVEVLFAPGEEPLGGYVRVNGVEFKVVGVFASHAVSEDAEQAVQKLFVPFTSFQNAFNYGDQVDWFAITAKPGVPASRVEEKVLRVLAARHQVAPDDSRAFGHWNTEEEYNKVMGLFRGISILVWIVGSGTLAAGVIGVSNIMLIIIKERTKEIGLRRAVGATPLGVARQVLLEAVLLTSVAGYLGLVAGVGVIELVRQLLEGADTRMFKDPEIALATALQALVILIIAGGLAGLIPARRAVAIRPIEALRSE